MVSRSTAGTRTVTGSQSLDGKQVSEPVKNSFQALVASRPSPVRAAAYAVRRECTVRRECAAGSADFHVEPVSAVHR